MSPLTLVRPASEEARVRILLVDRAEATFVQVHEALRASRSGGFDVDWVEEADKALRALAAQDYDVCMLGGSVRGGTSAEVATQIATAAPDLPILAVGDILSNLDSARMSAAGASGNLPVRDLNPDLLATTLRALAGERWARRAADAAQSHRAQSVERLLALASNMLARRDSYSTDHQRRVAQLVALMGRELRLPDDSLETLVQAASLFEVGNIGVSMDLLNKPAVLHDIEMDLVKEHVPIGVDILQASGFDPGVMDIVAQHHERLDGSGYPAGLSGVSILFEARILAVADAYDALRAYRPYRRAHTAPQALRMLQGLAGHSYDERVVDALSVCLAEQQEQKGDA